MKNTLRIKMLGILLMSLICMPLAAANSIYGKTRLMPGGAAMPDVAVTLVGPNGSTTVQSDGLGNYQINGIDDGCYTLSATFNSDQTYESYPVVVNLSLGNNLEEELWLVLGGQDTMGDLIVKIHDNASGDAVAGAIVIVQGPSGMMGAISDQGGWFKFHNLPAGAYVVTSFSSQYATQVSFAMVAAQVRNDLAVGMDAAVNDPNIGLLAGVARDDSGAFLAGLTVSVEAGGNTYTSMTNAFGCYIFLAIPSGPVTVTVSNDTTPVKSASYLNPGTAIFTSLRSEKGAPKDYSGISQADLLAKVPLCYRSQDRTRMFFDAGAASRDLSVKIFALTGEPLAGLAASHAGEVLALDVASYGKGVYLAKVSFKDSGNNQVCQMRKFAVYR